MRDVPTLIIVLNEDGQGPQAPVHNHTTNRLAPFKHTDLIPSTPAPLSVPNPSQEVKIVSNLV